ncbi:MAG: hypothetical protein WA160_13250 [Pseudobdellovibrio sp.]
MLTENNHFQYGRINDDIEVFFSKLGKNARPILSGYEEAKLAALKIKLAANNQVLELCVSGGIDSEVMLISFLEAKVDFNVNILKFKNDFNDYDTFNVIEFCKQKNLKINIIELDIISFFESGQSLVYGSKYQCQSPQIAVHLWMLDQVKGYPVLSGNFIYPMKTESGFFYVGLPGELHCAYFRYFDLNKREGVPWFLIYTAELYQSFFNTKSIQAQLRSEPENQLEFSYVMKCQIYNEAGFNVKPRPDKYTGFEKVRKYYDDKFGTLNGTKFDELFRKPLEELFPFPKEFLQLIPNQDVD